MGEAGRDGGRSAADGRAARRAGAGRAVPRLLPAAGHPAVRVHDRSDGGAGRGAGGLRPGAGPAARAGRCGRPGGLAAHRRDQRGPPAVAAAPAAGRHPAARPAGAPGWSQPRPEPDRPTCATRWPRCPGRTARWSCCTTWPTCRWTRWPRLLGVPVGTVKSRLSRARGPGRPARRLPARRRSHRHGSGACLTPTLGRHLARHDGAARRDPDRRRWPGRPRARHAAVGGADRAAGAAAARSPRCWWSLGPVLAVVRAARRRSVRRPPARPPDPVLCRRPGIAINGLVTGVPVPDLPGAAGRRGVRRPGPRLRDQHGWRLRQYPGRRPDLAAHE